MEDPLVFAALPILTIAIAIVAVMAEGARRSALRAHERVDALYHQDGVACECCSIMKAELGRVAERMDVFNNELVRARLLGMRLGFTWDNASASWVHKEVAVNPVRKRKPVTKKRARR